MTARDRARRQERRQAHMRVTAERGKAGTKAGTPPSAKRRTRRLRK